VSGRSNNLRVQVDVESQFSGEKSFKSAESSALAMARAMDKVDAAARAMAAAEEAAYRQADQAAAAHEAQVRKMAQAEISAYREAERAATEKTAEQRRMAQQEAAAYREGEQLAAKREADVRRMAQVEAAAYREAEQAAEKAAAARRMSEDDQRQAMTKVGTVLAATSAAAIAGLGIATRAAMSWESAWAGVTKTVDGTPAQMDALEGSLRSLAKTLPASQEEIAGVAEAAGQLGVKREDILGFTKTMIDLGETTNLSADEAATGLAQFMNVMQSAPEDVARLGATLVALGNDGASTEADILAMAQRISGAGKLVGASEADVLALANAMASVGIEAELGGGVTTRVMQKIYTAVKEGGDGLASFAQVAGMSSDEFTAAWEDRPVAAMDAVFQGLGRVNASGGNVVATLKDLGLKGTEEASVLLRMAGAGDLLSRSLELGGDAWAENAALAEEANKRYATTEARLQMARNQINDTAIDIGGNLLPMLATGAEFAGDLASAFGMLSEGQQEWVVALGAGVAGITGVVGVASIAIPKVFELKTTLDELAGGSSRVGKGLGAALSVMTGPWGIALAAATVLVGAWAAEQGAAAQRVQTLSEAIDGQTGSFTEAARAIVATNLGDAGALSAAKNLGLQLDVVTDAALGQADAMRQVQAAIQGAYDQEQAASLGKGEYTDATIANADAAALLERALGNQTGETAEAIEAARLKAEAMGEDTSATGAAGDASETAAGQVDELGRSTEGSAEAMEKLGDAIRGALGQFFDVENATSAVEASIDSMTEAVKENGTSVDLTTEQGRANAAALQDRVNTTGDLIAAMAREGQSSEELSAKTTQLKNDFILQMQAAGFSQEAIERYAGSFDLIPEQVATTVKAETTGAEAKLDGILSRLAMLPSERATTVRINEITTRGGNTGGGLAEGGVVDYFADGGVVGARREDHVAQIAPGGSYRVWAEDETEGEGYIPLAPSKRPRSKKITEEIVARFGGHVEWYANGGIAGGAEGAVVSRSMVMAALTATTSPVDDTRRTAALRQQAAAAQIAAAAERYLTQVRERGTAALKEEGERQEVALQALKDRNTASEDAGQKEVERLRKAKAGDGAIAAAQDRLTSLKRANDAAEKALKKSQDGENDAAKVAQKKAEATASETLTRAKEREKDATDELKDSEKELADARERAVQFAQRSADALSRRANLSDVASDVTARKAAARDAKAAKKDLDAALADADAAGGNARGETRAAALERRSGALEALAAAGVQWASAQRAMGTDSATVQTGLDQVRAKVEALGAAYGLTGQQLADMTEALADQGEALPTGEELLGGLMGELERMKETAKAISELEAAGLDRGLVDQLFEKGTDQGLAMAKALLSGGAGLIGKFNTVQSDINGTASGFGSSLSAGRFTPGSRLEAQPVSLLEGASVGLVADTHVALAANTAVGLLAGTSVGIDAPVLADMAQRITAALATRPLIVNLDGSVVFASMQAQAAQAAIAKAP